MIEAIAIVAIMILTAVVMRSARRRRMHLLEPADYVDVASAMRVVKRTATPHRADGRKLGAVFDDNGDVRRLQ